MCCTAGRRDNHVCNSSVDKCIFNEQPFFMQMYHEKSSCSHNLVVVCVFFVCKLLYKYAGDVSFI